ncbi:hypothetical protein [Bacillus marasmi]|uniref:hypothetical protein n=1 Tax=Bacillus marasmi TaxID=1926279 RepID=UPI0011CA3BE6|nr:hypothetical protein [Bacillus marasmi]
MIVNAINDYFVKYSPCLHINHDEPTGATMHAMSDVNSVIISVWENQFRENDGELHFLMNTPIEIGVYEKNGHVMPIMKIGPESDPYLYYLPLNPIDPDCQGTMDLWIESRHIVVCFIEGGKELSFQGIRVLGIPDELRDFLVNKWIDAIEQGACYGLKYLNFVNGFKGKDILEVWKEAKRFEELEE